MNIFKPRKRKKDGRKSVLIYQKTFLVKKAVENQKALQLESDIHH